MADVYDYEALTGTIVPDTQSIQSEVEAEYITAFGADFITTPDTTNGVLVTAETLARTSVAENNAQVANQFNPDYSGGVYLDALMALLGTPRLLGTPTIVNVTLSGVPSSIIPSGTLVQDSVHNMIFATVATVVIPMGGSVTVPVQAVKVGAVQIAPATITILIAPIPTGLETVTNAAAQTVIGTDSQSDVQAGIYRRQTLATQGSSLSEAIISSVRAVPGVTSLFFFENETGSSLATPDNAITLVPHSIYLCVNGGVDSQVAVGIDRPKSGGCAYNNGAAGATPVSVAVTDPFSGQIKTVLFDRPAIIPVIVTVTVVANPEIQNPQALVQQAINDYASGKLSQEPGLTVGTSVSAFELAGAINREIPGIFVKNVGVSASGGTPSYVTLFPITSAQVAQITQITTTVVNS